MSKKLYVGNLPFEVTEQAFEEAFAAFGNVVSVKLITDRETGRARGFGFVELENAVDAETAIAEMNGKNFGGRELVVNEARPPQKREGGSGGNHNSDRRDARRDNRR